MKLLLPLLLLMLFPRCQNDLHSDNPNSDFIGTWKLQKWTAQLADGSHVSPYGERAYGKLIYESSGEVTAIFMADDRAKLSSEGVADRIAKEALEAFNSFFAFAGPYKVHRDSGFVIHHIEACINPNWIGRDQKRFFELKGNQLILSTPPIEVKGTQSQSVSQVLIWNKEN